MRDSTSAGIQAGLFFSDRFNYSASRGKEMIAVFLLGGQ
jgi:hypothetical protein